MEHYFYLSRLHLVPLNLLFDRRGGEAENPRPLDLERVIWVKVVKPEVAHDQVVRVVLVRVMTLIKNEQIDLLHVHEAVHEQVVELVGDDDENVLLGQLHAPLLRVPVVIVLLLSAVVAADTQLCVRLYCRSLLLD